MEPLKITTISCSRGRGFLIGSGRSSADEHARQFPIGLGSLSRTLTHIMICEFAYVLRIEERRGAPLRTI